MNNREIRILSRKSDLAQIQSKFVGLALINKFPNIKVSYLTKTTEGDIDKKSPLSEMKSTGVFTDDLRKNLIDNKCDLIVHSWKDLPIEIEKQIVLMIIVRSEGYEPSTPRAEIWYSIQLNY